MTAFAFILGVLPLVVATGPGTEMRQALGTAAFYGLIGRLVIRWGGRRGKRRGKEPHGEPAHG